MVPIVLLVIIIVLFRSVTVADMCLVLFQIFRAQYVVVVNILFVLVFVNVCRFLWWGLVVGFVVVRVFVRVIRVVTITTCARLLLVSTVAGPRVQSCCRLRCRGNVLRLRR
jgi:hypothetical protein